MTVERPSPPAGYATWLDWMLRQPLSGAYVDAARAELAELHDAAERVGKLESRASATWTREPPTEPGWYWVRDRRSESYYEEPMRFYPSGDEWHVDDNIPADGPLLWPSDFGDHFERWTARLEEPPQ